MITRHSNPRTGQSLDCLTNLDWLSYYHANPIWGTFAKPLDRFPRYYPNLPSTALFLAPSLLPQDVCPKKADRKLLKQQVGEQSLLSSLEPQLSISFSPLSPAAQPLEARLEVSPAALNGAITPTLDVHFPALLQLMCQNGKINST